MRSWGCAAGIFRHTAALRQAARYEDDRFSGFDYQATIDTEATKLTAQAGLRYRKLREELLDKLLVGSGSDNTLVVNLVYEIR